jgi:hypothetical protein
MKRSLLFSLRPWSKPATDPAWPAPSLFRAHPSRGPVVIEAHGRTSYRLGQSLWTYSMIFLIEN